MCLEDGWLRCVENAERRNIFGSKFDYKEPRDRALLIQKARKMFISFTNKPEEDLIDNDCYAYYIGMIDFLDKIEWHFEKAIETFKNRIGEEAKKELMSYGRLLREIWREYEDELLVRRIRYDEKIPNTEKQDSGKYAVNIDIGLDMEGYSRWVSPYHYIFHEFFHLIHDNAMKSRNALISMSVDFGMALKQDIKDDPDSLLEEEKGGKKSTDKRLNNLSYRTDERSKATLYDAIGAVLHKGKYGCHPPSSQYYTGTDSKCADENGCDVRTKKNCKHDKLFGHNLDAYGYNYWEVKSEKKDGRVTTEKRNFPLILATETLANMVSDAIVNPMAYEKIIECLPKSFKLFKKILMEILSVKSRFLRC